MNIQALETRQQIYEFIQSHPGMHFREMQRRLGIAVGTLQHHLAQLEKEKLVIGRKDGEYTRYFPVGTMTERDRFLLKFLRQAPLRRALLLLLERPSANHRQISERLRLSPATTSWYLGKLLEAGLIERKKVGREAHYSLKDAKEMARMLVAYRESFFDKLVDRFAELWMK